MLKISPDTNKQGCERCEVFLDEISRAYQGFRSRFGRQDFWQSLFLWKDAALVMTDSGGLQEETTALSVPCITLSENTERPITIGIGTNVLAGNKKESIVAACRESLEKRGKEFSVPPKWDGRAAERILKVLIESNRDK